MADKLYYEDYLFSVYFDPTPGDSGYYWVDQNQISFDRFKSVSEAIEDARKIING